MVKAVLFSLSFLWCLSANAQPLPSLNNSDNTFVAGIIFGGNISKVSGTNYNGYHKLGFNTGLSVYGHIKNKWWASIEILYSQKGMIGVREENSDVVGPYFEKYYMRLNYAELPVMLHFFQEKWYHFSVGASYSMLLNSSEDLVSYQPTNLYTNIATFNQREFDFLAGGGLHVNKNLYLNIRYQKSLTPIRAAFRVPPAVGAGNQYSTLFAIQLVYMLRNHNLSDDPAADY